MITILLAEDVQMVRGALVALLDLEPDLTVVAETPDGDMILPQARRYRPDVAVIDIDLPGKDGLTAAAELRDEIPECRTLILTSLNRPGVVRRALAAKVGGFLLKDSPSNKLAGAVRDVYAGRRVLDGDLAASVWDTGDCPLTDRELEVLRLAAQGGGAVDIAGQLFLSPGTVRNYLTAAVTKLDARNRVDAIRRANDAGWL